MKVRSIDLFGDTPFRAHRIGVVRDHDIVVLVPDTASVADTESRNRVGGK
jgi:hypothetical protein